MVAAGGLCGVFLVVDVLVGDGSRAGMVLCVCVEDVGEKGKKFVGGWKYLYLATRRGSSQERWSYFPNN